MAVIDLESKSLQDLPELANKILERAEKQKVVLFRGEMGVGKTTLIKALCKALKVKDSVSSPTYSLVNEYQAANGDPIYHFDFYRIANETEALDIGVEEYLYSGNYCFLEWPEKIESLLTEDYLEVNISNENEVRHIKLITP